MVNDDPQQKQEDLQQEGLPAPVGMPTASKRPSLEALAFLANVPAKYWHLLAPLHDAEKAVLEQREKEERDAEFWENALEMIAQHQRQIDENRLSLRINGMDVEISQGDLRKAMTTRLDELKEQRRTMPRNGRDGEDAQRLDRLIERYEPLVDRLKNEKADAATIAEVQELAKKDPTLGERMALLNSGRAPVLASSDEPTRVSYATANFNEDGISAFKLRDPFTKSASPTVAPALDATAAAPAAVEKEQRSVSNSVQALSF